MSNLINNLIDFWFNNENIDSENYKEKLNTIKENYFKKSTSETTDSKETAGTNKEIQDNKTSVDSYVQAITKSIKK